LLARIASRACDRQVGKGRKVREILFLATVVVASMMFENAASARHDGSQGSPTTVTCPARTCGPNGSKNASSPNLCSRESCSKR
jgi:hypothetical protein